MILGTYPKSLHEALALRGLLAELGYLEEELSFVLHGNDVCIGVEADGKEIYLRVGNAELPPNEMQKKWLELRAEWNTGGTMTPEDKDKVYMSSVVFEMRVSIMVNLVKNGFDINRWKTNRPKE